MHGAPSRPVQSSPDTDGLQIHHTDGECIEVASPARLLGNLSFFYYFSLALLSNPSVIVRKYRVTSCRDLHAPRSVQSELLKIVCTPPAETAAQHPLQTLLLFHRINIVMA